MILKIYVDDHYEKGIDVPVTPQSTVSDILECCRQPYDCHFQLVETWRNHERVVGADERLFEILMRWGEHQNEVRFRLRQNRGTSGNENSIDFSSSLDRALLAGKDMTYQEMQDRVVQQRRLIERQQQMILAKEQRLRFLRQQENLHRQQKARGQTSEPIRKHEKKLQQLKSARGDVIGPASANQETENQIELETYKQVFDTTEKQLSLIIGKTEVLAKHLQDFQSTRCEPSISEECQRLRAELLLRKTLNNEQNSKIVSHNQKLVKRKEEIALLDAKIALLQNRLHVSKLQKQNEKNGHSFGTAVAAVESSKNTDVRSTVPSDVLKPPSVVESRYQSLPPGKKPPLASVNKAATSGYEKDNGFARAYHTAELEENEKVTAMSKSLIESRGNTPDASEYGKIVKPNTRPWAVSSPSVNPMTAVGISSGFRASFPQTQPSAAPGMVPDRGPITEVYTMATTAPTVTWKNGPTFEKQPASSPDAPPTRFMPPFTASVVLPSKISQGTKPVYAMSGSGDARQSKESSAFRSSPSGRIHFDANPFQASSGAAGARRVASPSGKTTGIVATATDTDEADGGNANVYPQQNDPRGTNNFIPMAYIKQQAVQLDFKDQNLRTGIHPEGDNRAPMSSESHKSGDYKSIYSDAQARSLQPRFASMSVITDTYFRKPGSGVDARKAGEIAGRNPRRHRNTDEFVPASGSGISAGQPVASPAASIRPMQNNVRSSSTPPTVDARLARSSDNYGFQARRNEAQIAAGSNRPIPAAGKSLDLPVSFTRSGFSSRDNNTVAQLTSGISNEATSSSQHRFPYRVDRSNPDVSNPTQLPSKSRSYDVTDHANAPVQRDGKRISFSDEQFFPTGDTLYKLDGYGACYHAMRHSGDPERSPGHPRMNAPKPLRRRLSGDSNDDSLIRPAKYQQNRLVSETTLNAARTVMGVAIPESPQSHPPNDFPERDSTQYSRNFAPFVPPSSSLGHAGVASQENQISSVATSRSFPADISPPFSDNLARVLNSPVVTKPPEIPILPPASTHPNFSPTPAVDSHHSLDPSTNNSDPVSTSNEPISEPSTNSSTPNFHPDRSLSPVITVSLPPDDTRNLISPLKDVQSDPPKDGFDQKRNSGGGEVDMPLEGEPEPVAFPASESNPGKQSNLKKSRSGRRTTNRVTFDPMVLLLDACLEGELETVKKTAKQVEDPSMPNDEGITALHNAICAGNFEIVKFLVEYGCDVNAADTDGWTPLHCSASCNNLEMTRLLVENGACVFAVTTSDQETASEKCERDEEGFETCHKYLLDMEEKLGKSNHGSVYALFDYTALEEDELGFQCGDKITVLRKGDEAASQWWFSRLQKKEGYVPRNYLGAYPRVAPKWNSAK